MPALPNPASLRTLASFACIALFGGLMACSPSPNGSNGGPLLPGTLKDMSTIPADKDMGPLPDGMNPIDDDMADGGDMTQEGDGGTVIPAEGLCNNITDLGVLDPMAGTMMLTGSTIDTTILNEFATSCGSGPAPEVGWRFTVEEPIGIKSNILSAGIGWVLELHDGNCTQLTRRFCDDALETRFTLPPGEYVLIAEPRTNMRGELTLQLDLTPLVCFPVGQTECDGNDLSICAGGGATQLSRACAEPCNMGACGGDLCENAIVVDSLPYTFSGSVEGYLDRINFNEANSCTNPSTAVASGGNDDPDQPDNPDPPEPGEPSGLIRTPGQDVVFLVKNLTQGQKLFVDASAAAGDDADSVLFVLDSCDKMTCHLAVDLGDIINGWEIPADGDYTIILDRTTDNSADLGIEIRVE